MVGDDRLVLDVVVVGVVDVVVVVGVVDVVVVAALLDVVVVWPDVVAAEAVLWWASAAWTATAPVIASAVPASQALVFEISFSPRLRELGVSL